MRSGVVVVAMLARHRLRGGASRQGRAQLPAAREIAHALAVARVHSFCARLETQSFVERETRAVRRLDVHLAAERAAVRDRSQVVVKTTRESASSRLRDDHHAIDVEERWISREEPAVIRSLRGCLFVERDKEAECSFDDPCPRRDADELRECFVRQRVDLGRVLVVEREQSRQVPRLDIADVHEYQAAMYTVRDHGLVRFTSAHGAAVRRTRALRSTASSAQPSREVSAAPWPSSVS
jgi:hypothetical protein